FSTTIGQQSMIRRFVAVFAFIAAGSPVLALSCLPPDAVRLYEMARDAEEAYYFVKGRIDLTGPAQEPDPNSDAPALTRAHISGTALNSHGFGTSFEQDITIEASCLSVWCGSAENLTGELFTAMRIINKELTLRVGPCGGDVVQWDQDAERRLLECHRTGICAATR
ncbi:MAG: hypothetical protein N2B03_01180, partial [Boseongicola sp.]